MLYFCEEPKLQAQIMHYCKIDGIRFRRFCEHCMRRGILKGVRTDYGLQAYIITDRGKEVLATAEDIIRALGPHTTTETELK